jgi:hypothetical protein
MGAMPTTPSIGAMPTSPVIGMPRAGAGMPGTMARNGVGAPATGGARGMAPTSPGLGGAQGELLAIPGIDGQPIIPDSTPMREPIVPAVPVPPGQSTLPAPPSVNN